MVSAKKTSAKSKTASSAKTREKRFGVLRTFPQKVLSRRRQRTPDGACRLFLSPAVAPSGPWRVSEASHRQEQPSTVSVRTLKSRSHRLPVKWCLWLLCLGRMEAFGCRGRVPRPADWVQKPQFRMFFGHNSSGFPVRTIEWINGWTTGRRTRPLRL